MSREGLDRVATARVARAELIKRVLIALTAVLVVFLVALVLVLLSRVSEQSQDNARLLAIIEDCTNPTGACAKRGQESTETAVATINEIALYAAACADRPGDQTLAEIKRCVEDLITAAASPVP